MTEDVDGEFSSRFDWRRSTWIQNLAQLHSIVSPDLLDLPTNTPQLFQRALSDDPLDALRWAIATLWLQTVHCFIFGQFEASILAAGAVVERILKLEYRQAKGPLPPGQWTLGRCVHNLDWSSTRMTDSLLDDARTIVDPRNDRTHALLEHAEPRVAMFGGRRDVDLLSDKIYIIHPYKGDAEQVLPRVWNLIISLYGSRDA